MHQKKKKNFTKQAKKISPIKSHKSLFIKEDNGTSATKQPRKARFTTNYKTAEEGLFYINYKTAEGGSSYN